MTRHRALRDPFYDDEAMRGGFFSGLGELIATYPSIAGGSAAFAVIFGFVASNALWYQPGKHPAPILQTRPMENAELTQPDDLQKVIRQAVQTEPSREITTFRIKKEDNPLTGSIPVPQTRPEWNDGDDRVTAAGAPAASDTRPDADPLLMDIQTLLKQKGFYGGEVDGLTGPMSRTAISNWQKKAGLDVNGQVSEELLESLRIGGRPQSIAPRSSQPEVTEPVSVAAPRAQAPEEAQMVPVTRDAIAEVIAPQTASVSDAVTQLSGATELVRQIQSGLSNIAYADIAVDGFAGQQTRDAISAFEKHYRLPVTGEPNSQVLQKLVEIGAL